MILPMKNATITLPYKSQPPAGIKKSKLKKEENYERENY